MRHLPSATKARVHLHPPGALVAPRGVTDGRHLMAAYILWDPQHSSQQATAVHAQMEKPTAAPSPSARPPSDTSKTDHTDVRLSDAVYQHLCAHPVLRGRTPTLDVFASHLNTKVPGRFYSLTDCPGSLGVDAFQHPWGMIGGEKQLAYIHGPIHSSASAKDTVERIINKVRRFWQAQHDRETALRRNYVILVQQVDMRSRFSSRMPLCMLVRAGAVPSALSAHRSLPS